MALTNEKKKTILDLLQTKGKNGKVMKADLTAEEITTLQGFAGEDMDCNFTFTKKDKDDKDKKEKMFCNKFLEGDDFFITDRDAHFNYDPKDGEEASKAAEKAAKLAELKAKTDIV